MEKLIYYLEYFTAKAASESLRGCEYKHDEVVPVELTKDHQIDPMYAYFKENNATPAFPYFEDLPRTPGIAFDVFYIPAIDIDHKKRVHRITLSRKHIKYTVESQAVPFAYFIDGELACLKSGKGSWHIFNSSTTQWRAHIRGGSGSIIDIWFAATKITVEPDPLFCPKARLAVSNYYPNFYGININSKCTFLSKKQFNIRRQLFLVAMLAIPINVALYAAYWALAMPVLYPIARLQSTEDCEVRRYHVAPGPSKGEYCQASIEADQTGAYVEYSGENQAMLS